MNRSLARCWESFVLTIATAIALCVMMMAGAPVTVMGQGPAAHSAMKGANPDYEVQTRIEKRLRLEDTIHWRNLSVDVTQGKVTLDGMVRTMEEKGLATKLAVTVPGVEALMNRIIVNPELPALQEKEEPHIETTSRDRVIEGQERLKDKQILP